MSPQLMASCAAAVLLLMTGVAAADPGTTTRDGKTLTVSEADGLRVDGEKVRVRGSGYDRSKGIYVAFCVDNGPGKVPTPCGGGADTEGTSGNSVWISDFPPAYGTGLAQPYDDGGSFDVQIHVRALLRADDPETEQDETVDCRTTRCAVVTRNDHTRSEDRSQDVALPISFAAAPAPTEPETDRPASAAPPRTSSSSARDTTAADGPAEVASAAPSLGVGTSATPSTAPTAAAPGDTESAAPDAQAEDGSAFDASGSDPAASPASASTGTVLLPVLVAGAVVAAATGGAVAWRRRAVRGAPAHG